MENNKPEVCPGCGKPTHWGPAQHCYDPAECTIEALKLVTNWQAAQPLLVSLMQTFKASHEDAERIFERHNF